MSHPPFVEIRATAKHGSDERLLALRDEIRWLAAWASDVYAEICSIYEGAEILMSPRCFDEDNGFFFRDVTLKLKLSEHNLETISHILSYNYDIED